MVMMLVLVLRGRGVVESWLWWGGAGVPSTVTHALSGGHGTGVAGGFVQGTGTCGPG